MRHLAVLRERYLEALLSGAKTVESRLSRTRQPPYGRVSPGDEVFFKTPGGPVAAVATVVDVQSHCDLTPNRIRALKRDLNGAVLAENAYWKSKEGAKYATFIRLAEVRATEARRRDLAPPLNGRGWVCLDRATHRSAPRQGCP